MTSEQWERVKEEFEQARDAPAEYRCRMLARVDDAEIREELEGLFRAYDESQEFLENPAILARPAFRFGRRLGSYSLVRQVGEGGMGVVYEAVRADGEFEHRVAIKVVKTWLTGEQNIARFRAERQILARLDHPNIARLLDGGTTPDGLPFLVMEFVDGSRIDDYCRGHGLETTDRLRLFRQVIEAVGYAHSQGVVHRDLKPANILVTAASRPKLLDFGIAKVVDPEITHTATITVGGPATPQYASPEQLRGEPTTPSSDIYSLGVVLYELLTGQSPYAGKDGALPAISRAVYEQEPPPPSRTTGNAAWRRNLDRIVATAMQKDPAARYRNADELIGDIDACIAGQTVHRRPHRPWARERWSIAWIFAIVLALVSAVWMLKTPALFKREPGFQQLYSEGMERQQHSDWPAARSLFRRAVEAEPGNPLGHYAYSAALHKLGYESLARREAKLAYDRSSGLSEEQKLLTRGRFEEYTSNRASAVTTYKQLWSLNHKNPDYGLRLASAQADAGSPADARRTLDSIRGIPAGSSDDVRILLQRARIHELLSEYQQELVDAEAAARTADRIGARELKAEAFEAQGDALREMNRFEEAIRIYTDSEALSREDGDLYEVSSIENRLGGMYFNKGDYSALEAHGNTALALFRQIDNKTAQASILNNLSLARKSRGDLPGALDMIQQAVAISKEAGDLHSQSRELTNMGTMLRRLGRESEAKEAFEQSLACAQRLDDRDQIARSHITLEMLNRDEGNLQAALEHVRMALNLLAGSKTAGLRALTLQHLGDDLHASGDVERGKKALEDSLALARQANSNQLIADDSYMLADIARVQQAFHRGEELLREAEDYYIAQHQNVNLWDAWVTESRLRIAEGHAAGTDKKIQQSVAGFQTVKDEARECGAYAALLESYLAQKKPNHASRALAASRMLCSGTGEYDSRMLYAIRAIEVKAAVGDAAQAQQQLQSIAQDLETNGWGVLAREARTACCYVRRR